MSEIAAKNQAAIRQLERAFNERMNKMTDRISTLEFANKKLQEQVNFLKEEKLKDMCARMGNGPTAA